MNFCEREHSLQFDSERFGWIESVLSMEKHHTKKRRKELKCVESKETF